MADTELKGTIKLDADTSKAKRQIKEVGDSPETQSLGQRLGEALKDAFGGFGAGRRANVGTAADLATGGGSVGKLGTFGKTALAVGAIAAAIAGIAVAIKGMLSFADRLSQSSGAMASVMAQFRFRMQMVSMRLGNALAPAFKELTDSLLELTEAVLPLLEAGLKGLAKALSTFTNFGAKVIQNPSELLGFSPLLSPLKNLVRAIEESNKLQKMKGLGGDKSPQNVEDFFRFLDRDRDEMLRQIQEEKANQQAIAENSGVGIGQLLTAISAVGLGGVAPLIGPAFGSGD